MNEKVTNALKESKPLAEELFESFGESRPKPLDLHAACTQINKRIREDATIPYERKLFFAVAGKAPTTSQGTSGADGVDSTLNHGYKMVDKEKAIKEYGFPRWSDPGTFVFAMPLKWADETEQDILKATSFEAKNVLATENTIGLTTSVTEKQSVVIH